MLLVIIISQSIHMLHQPSSSTAKEQSIRISFQISSTEENWDLAFNLLAKYSGLCAQAQPRSLYHSPHNKSETSSTVPVTTIGLTYLVDRQKAVETGPGPGPPYHQRSRIVEANYQIPQLIRMCSKRGEEQQPPKILAESGGQPQMNGREMKTRRNLLNGNISR